MASGDDRALQRDDRSDAERAADHVALERLTQDLLPALVAKLSASGLGEIEIREGGWKVRLRRPAAPGGGGAGNVGVQARRTGDRAGRAQPGHEGHGHPRAAGEGRRGGRDARDGGRETRAAFSGNGADRGEPIAPEREPVGGDAVANSPTVGIFRSGTRPGTRVRAGDRVATVDLLGIPQDVVAPIDGFVGQVLVEAGNAVEYGEPVVVVQRSEHERPDRDRRPEVDA